MALAPIRVGPECRLRARWPRPLPTFFFGTENLRAQSVMTGALSVLIFAGLLTVVVIDHPFAGTVKVGPEALAAVVKDFAGAPPQR